MLTASLHPTWLRTALLDAVLLAGIAFMPAAAHLVSFPLYQFEPMRIVLFASLVYSGRGNGYALAVGMPLIAFATSGHPVPPKLFLIQFELVANVWAFHLVLRRAASRNWAFAEAALVSVVIAKSAYYGLKFLAIRFGMINGSLVTTAWLNQLTVVFLVAVAGQAAWSARNRQGQGHAG